MKVLLANTFANSGGAARAAYRLHQGLVQIGVHSRMLVQNNPTDDWRVRSMARSLFQKAVSRVRPQVDRLPLRCYFRRQSSTWSVGWLSNPISSIFNGSDAEIIHLHWVVDGFVPIREIKRISRPLVWTLHDMWAFTGGCHYAFDCPRFIESCGRCPQLRSASQFDVSRFAWREKKIHWKNRQMTIVCPSRWIARLARLSSILNDKEIIVIPNGIDTSIYKPLDKNHCREILGLPKDRRIILFGALGAGNKAKGGHILHPAVQELRKMVPDCSQFHIAIFGAGEPKAPVSFGIPCTYVGRLSDDIALSVLYSAVDVTVVPSLTDNLPNIVLESLSCGTPVAAFNIGGMPDMIEHRVNGYLAEPYESEDLARGIAFVLSDAGQWPQLSAMARNTAVRNFELKAIAHRHRELYENVLAKHR